MKKYPWILFSVLSALLLLTGLYPWDLWILAWFGFLPLLALALDPSLKTRYLFPAALLTGILYFGYGLICFLDYDPAIYILVLLSTAPGFGLYFLLYRFLIQKTTQPLLKILAAPMLWIVIQKIYSYTPIGTLAFEVPFYGPLSFFQILSVLGFQTQAALVIGLNASVAFLLMKKEKKYAVLLTLVFSSLLIASHLWGNRQIKTENPSGPPVKAALIQHNLPVDLLWNATHQKEIRETYRRLALKAAVQKPDLIIFPLYDMNDDVLRHPESMTGLARETRALILLATYIPSDEGREKGFYDMAILYSPEGKIYDAYKAKSPPPFRNIGEKNVRESKVLGSPFGKMGVHLCYENGLARQTRKAVQLGAEILVSLSNPGRFNKTFLPYYHLMQDRMRAIESGRYVLRVSPNGYSAFIDPQGRLMEKTRLDEEHILYVPWIRRTAMTPFQKNPDGLALVSWVGIFLILAGKKTAREQDQAA